MQGSKGAGRYSCISFNNWSVAIHIAASGLYHQPPPPASTLTPHCGLSQELGILSQHCVSNIFLVIFTWETDPFKISVLTSVSLHSIFKLASICPRSVVA